MFRWLIIYFHALGCGFKETKKETTEKPLARFQRKVGKRTSPAKLR